MSYTAGATRDSALDSSAAHNNLEDEDDYVVDDSEYAADLADRSGLPVIPKGVPPKNDRIDVDAISREFENRAIRRPSPAAAATSGLPPVPLARISTSSQPHPLDEDLDEFEYEPPERRLSRKKLPKRTLFTALFLLGVGVVFSTLGLSFLFTLGASEALPFLIIGGIGFIPGSYVSFIIYQTWKGVPGYSFDQIPSYDD